MGRVGKVARPIYVLNAESEVEAFLFLFFHFVLSLNRSRVSAYSAVMSTKYIVSAILGSFGIAWVCDYYVSEKKIFGGSTPGTITNKEWGEETDKKFQAWPRTAGPPVVVNPITRQNFVVKSRSE
ncbi:uncharacterized protein LOC106757297 [Vigna radiata var. radiata]|uniref:Uncharacterized protein LOC106757297 n=2 Tax=Vigna radiata var. radiata TaxID=3916 RepID=A0A1S3TNX9_VIGRR|nr:uncharacterized protein LOC106757297 [Vigna radiata var. radiata]